MTTTLNLTEADLREAVALLAKSRGFKPKRPAFLYIDPGDRPGSGPTIHAHVEVEMESRPLTGDEAEQAGREEYKRVTEDRR